MATPPPKLSIKPVEGEFEAPDYGVFFRLNSNHISLISRQLKDDKRRETLHPAFKAQSEIQGKIWRKSFTKMFLHNDLSADFETLLCSQVIFVLEHHGGQFICPDHKLFAL